MPKQNKPKKEKKRIKILALWITYIEINFYLKKTKKKLHLYACTITTLYYSLKKFLSNIFFFEKMRYVFKIMIY